jgi:hypothetical protein
MLLQNIPNGHNIHQHLSLQDPLKLNQIWIFGLKIYHLATLVATTLWPQMLKSVKLARACRLKVYLHRRGAVDIASAKE